MADEQSSSSREGEKRDTEQLASWHTEEVSFSTSFFTKKEFDTASLNMKISVFLTKYIKFITYSILSCGEAMNNASEDCLLLSSFFMFFSDHSKDPMVCSSHVTISGTFCEILKEFLLNFPLPICFLRVIDFDSVWGFFKTNS